MKETTPADQPSVPTENNDTSNSIELPPPPPPPVTHSTNQENTTVSEVAPVGGGEMDMEIEEEKDTSSTGQQFINGSS